MRLNIPDTTVRAMPEFKDRRTSPPRGATSFASQLAGLIGPPPAPVVKAPVPAAPRLPAAATRPTDTDPGDKDSVLASASFADQLPAQVQERKLILRRADMMLDIPYVWGGDTLKGLDCSSYVSRAWNVSRQTTDTLSKVADAIPKEELRAGDALNLPTWKDPGRYGHVRMFDRWANEDKTKVWVYEETSQPGRSVHHVIDYDSRYQPMRLRTLGQRDTPPAASA